MKDSGHAVLHDDHLTGHAGAHAGACPATPLVFIEAVGRGEGRGILSSIEVETLSWVIESLPSFPAPLIIWYGTYDHCSSKVRLKVSIQCYARWESVVKEPTAAEGWIYQVTHQVGAPLAISK